MNSHHTDTLGECVEQTIDNYFKDLNGEKPHALYDMVIARVEKTLLEFVLRYTNGNQSHAAKILGINRNTLRKRMETLRIEPSNELTGT